jgi:hypothetical protein
MLCASNASGCRLAIGLGIGLELGLGLEGSDLPRYTETTLRHERRDMERSETVGDGTRTILDEMEMDKTVYCSREAMKKPWRETKKGGTDRRGHISTGEREREREPAAVPRCRSRVAVS